MIVFSEKQPANTQRDHIRLLSFWFGNHGFETTSKDKLMSKTTHWLTVAGLLSVALLSGSVKAADARAVIIDTEGNEVGRVELMATPTGTLLRLELDGLSPGAKAIHIHSVGNCADPSEGFLASGGHINPDGQAHGLMNPEGPDAGDLPNFYVHDNGYAWAEFFTTKASLDGSIGAKILDDDGAALVIHTNVDDHSTQPIGGAGARVACGIIQVLN